jgi:hypothetical protein
VKALAVQRFDQAANFFIRDNLVDASVTVVVLRVVLIAHFEAVALEVGVNLLARVAHNLPRLVTLDLLLVRESSGLVNAELLTVFVIDNGVTSEKVRLVDVESGELGLLFGADVDQVGVIFVGVLLDPLEEACVVTDERSTGRKESVGVGDTLVDEVSIARWWPLFDSGLNESPVVVGVSWMGHSHARTSLDCQEVGLDGCKADSHVEEVSVTV